MEPGTTNSKGLHTRCLVTVFPKCSMLDGEIGSVTWKRDERLMIKRKWTWGGHVMHGTSNRFIKVTVVTLILWKPTQAEHQMKRWNWSIYCSKMEYGNRRDKEWTGKGFCLAVDINGW